MTKKNQKNDSEEINVESIESEEDLKEKQDSSSNSDENSGEEKKDEDLNTKYLRLMADFQNFKKRSENERNNVYNYANEEIICQLLEVFDNFERALDYDTDENFKKGMVMIFEQLKGVLKKFGVEEIDAMNQEFDPNLHNAVMMIDTDEVESGKVCEVVLKGYKMKDRVIRPTMVKVAN